MGLTKSDGATWRSQGIHRFFDTSRFLYGREKMNTKLPTKLAPESVIAIFDSREQNALNLALLTSVVSEMDIGEYSVSLRKFLTKTTTIFPAQKFSMHKKQAVHGVVDRQ
jgi:hypothetical protein